MAIYRYFHSRKYMIIKLNPFTLFISAIMLIISFISYYSGTMIFQIATLLFIIILCIIINKDILQKIVIAVMKKSGANSNE